MTDGSLDYRPNSDYRVTPVGDLDHRDGQGA